MTERCENCGNCYRLEKLDYSHGGCEHTEMEGFVCMAFASEGMANWMVGHDQSKGMCECYVPKEKKTCGTCKWHYHDIGGRSYCDEWDDCETVENGHCYKWRQPESNAFGRRTESVSDAE